MKKYDAIVIGSGQAGNPLSHRLSDQGWTVALIEKEHLGGSCINTGRPLEGRTMEKGAPH